MVVHTGDFKQDGCGCVTSHSASPAGSAGQLDGRHSPLGLPCLQVWRLVLALAVDYHTYMWLPVTWVSSQHGGWATSTCPVCAEHLLHARSCSGGVCGDTVGSQKAALTQLVTFCWRESDNERINVT